MTTVAATGGPSVDLVDSNKVTNYITQPFVLDENKAILRCASGLGPSGNDINTALGGWYFNGTKVPVAPTNCHGPLFEERAAPVGRFPGVLSLYLCGTFNTTVEGVYSCIMINSSMMNQIMRVGVYFSGRSE